MTTSTKTEPLSPETVKVGDGVTEGIGSDRYAGTVTYVSPSGKTIRFTQDAYRATEGSDYYGTQKYSYTSTPVVVGEDWDGKPNTNERTARWNARAQRFKMNGGYGSVSAGRNTYFDPSF